VATFENTVTIGRPIKEVLAFLSDFENVPKWNYAIVETRKVSEGPVGVGTSTGPPHSWARPCPPPTPRGWGRRPGCSRRG
jgi:Polyketide cyclase / dehydrase and lipid transport